MRGLTAHKDPRLQRWLSNVNKQDPSALRSQLAQNAVFSSPVVHTPQVGIDKTFMYLNAAGHVFADTGFHYTRFVVDGDNAVLEFQAKIDGIEVNGVDLIHWNSEGHIDDFKVMVRPMKAMNKLWEKMGAMLKKASL
eukprot:Clim_evm15s162 gene=Clim_evmTU15s162